MTIEPSDVDLTHLRAAIVRAADAASRGNRPFGSVVVDRSGEVVGAGENTVVATGSFLDHAEMNALRVVPADRLAGSTVYASDEPCSMCASAAHLAGVARIVYALPAAELGQVMGELDVDPAARAPVIGLPAEELLAHAEHPIELIGGSLADLSAATHRTYWSQFSR
jgi:tRNA(Arg) A34 adenosine deaminase TadA